MERFIAAAIADPGPALAAALIFTWFGWALRKLTVSDFEHVHPNRFSHGETINDQARNHGAL